MAQPYTTQLWSMIQRAEKLLGELEATYERDLQARQVSLDALNLTHEVLEKCSNALDQTMSLAFEAFIKPHLQIQPKRGGYFPAASSEEGYFEALAQWRARDLANFAPDLDRRLRSLQPFTSKQNAIYVRIKELANKKHTALAPQKVLEARRLAVASPHAAGPASYGSGVTLGAGVRMMTMRIDPETQELVPTGVGTEIREEIWRSFHFADGGEHALAFCHAAIQSTAHALRTIFDERA